MSVNSYQFKADYNEHDPEKKDAEWAGRLVTQFRQWMTPFVDPARAAKNRAYMLGQQDVTKYKKKFHKPDDLPFDFAPLGIFEKSRNILTAEREKAGIYIQLNALDPTAQTQKEFDSKLVANSAYIDSVLSYAQMAIGMPAYSLMKDKKIKDEKVANGNVQTFFELGLDPNSPADIAYFFKTHWRLDTQAEGEDIINFYVKLNDMQEAIKEWCDDVLAVKAIASRVYTDELTFTPVFKYLRPETVSWIPGIRRDGNDAKAIMVQENMTVADFLSRAGTEITPQNVKGFINAVNYQNTTNYDGLAYSNGTPLTTTCSNPVRYDNFLSLKIGVGYIEWKAIDVQTKKMGVNAAGNLRMYDKSYDWEPEKKDNYKKETIWNVTTYKSYFIVEGSSNQTLIKFGKLFDQFTEGADDEYSSYSFQLYKQPGQSAVEIAIPYIDNIHDAWYRFNWILNKAKPAGTRYNYNVIAKIASRMYNTDPDNEENGVMKVIELFHNSIDDFYVNDQLNPNVGGGQNPHFEKPNGLDASIKELSDVIKNQQDAIGEKLGINSVREAYSPNPNDGYKLQMQALAQSRNATEYLSRMIMSVLTNVGKMFLACVQDGIEFKGTTGYRAYERGLGIKSINALKSLDRMPAHKFGIFVESFNTDLERAEIKQEAKEAWLKGEIPYHVYLLVKAMDNFTKATEVLAYERGAELKRKQDEADKLHNQRMDEIKAQGEQNAAAVKAEYDGKKDVQLTANIGMKDVAQLNKEAHIEVKRMQIEAEPEKAAVRTQSKIAENDAQARAKRQEPAEMYEV